MCSNYVPSSEYDIILEDTDLPKWIDGHIKTLVQHKMAREDEESYQLISSGFTGLTKAVQHFFHQAPLAIHLKKEETNGANQVNARCRTKTTNPIQLEFED